MKNKKLSKDEQIKILQEELVRKNKIIEKLKKDKELLFKLTLKATKNSFEDNKSN